MEKLFERVPALEVAVRLLYWRVPQIHRLANGWRSREATRARRDAAREPTPIDFSKVLQALRDLGLRNGDIVIVHSSFAALKNTGYTPTEINAALLSAVGPSGTLAMPSIPLLAGEPRGMAKLVDESYDRLFVFNVTSRRILTGDLPKALMTAPGARRSRHPGNTMVAVGAEADPMMARNLEGEAPSPCGVGSSWHYAYERDALIVTLGLDRVHNLTMVHVAEEAFGADWPVAGWFRERRTRIVDGDYDQTIMIRERRHLWSQHLVERALAHDLLQQNISQTRVVDGLEIHACRARALVDFLHRHRNPTFPYVFPTGFPRKTAHT